MTERDPRTRFLLTVEDEEDPAGAGSSSVLEQETDIAETGDDTGDGQGTPKKTRFATEEGYDHLRKKADDAIQRAKLSDDRSRSLENRILRLEAERSKSEEDREHSRPYRMAGERAEEIYSRLAKANLDHNSPEYTKRYIQELLTPLYEDAPRIAHETSQRVAREEDARVRQTDKAGEAAEAFAIRELERAGLDESYLDDMHGTLALIERNDPGWYQRVADAEQIPELVKIVKTREEARMQKRKERQERKREHSEGMSDVIEEGSRHGRVPEPERKKGPGSMVADLKRFRQSRVQLGNEMFKHR